MDIRRCLPKMSERLGYATQKTSGPSGALSSASESDLRQRIVQLERIVEQQTARIAELERELARRKGRSRRGARAASSQSGASSSPRTDTTRRRSSGRSPGGQPGHEGHGRSWVSVEQVDELIPVKPSNCHRCGHPLTGDDPHPQRHQEVVIPPLRAEVIEYQVHTLRCAHCDRLTEAGWPEGVSRHTYGPSVQAWVGLLAGAYRLSKRNIRGNYLTLAPARGRLFMPVFFSYASNTSFRNRSRHSRAPGSILETSTKRAASA